MSDGRKVGSLSVVRGNGEGNGHRVGRLVALEPLCPAAPQQLGFVAVPGRASTVISLGMDGLEFASFCELLVAYGVRRIVDIRLLPAFRGRGFDPTAVFETFGRASIAYERMTELGNRFLGDPINERVRFNRLLAYLRGCHEALRRLRERIEQGPLLLLGRSADHRGSEREAVLMALGALEGSFDLIVTHPEDRAKGAAAPGRALQDLNGNVAQRMPEPQPTTSHQAALTTTGSVQRRPKRRIRPKHAQHKLKFEA